MKKLLISTGLIVAIAAGLLGVNYLSLHQKPQADAQTQIPTSPIKRCMNMGGALEAPSEGEWGYTIRQKDFATLKQAGFDTVRVPIKFSAHTDTRPPYKIKPDFLRRVNEVIDWALMEGLQIIIDVHHYEELMENPGPHERRLEAIWEQLAYHYHKAPPSLMFELINEPNGKMTVARTDALNARLLRKVRVHNPDRWVVVGSAGWGSMDALLESRPPQDPKVMTTFHYYDPFDVTHQGATWIPDVPPLGATWGTRDEYAQLSQDFSKAARWRNQTGMPLLVGEFGVIGKAYNTTRAKWTEAVRRESEKHGFGWCHWEWATGFPAYDLSRDQWDPAMRNALVGR